MSKDSVMGKEGRPGKGLQKYPIVLCDETFADFLTRIGMSEEEYIVTVQGTTSLSPDRAGFRSRLQHRDNILSKDAIHFTRKPLNVLALIA